MEERPKELRAVCQRKLVKASMFADWNPEVSCAFAP